MAHRINERNCGYWTLEGEPKKRTQNKKISRSFTEKEIEIFEYIFERVADNLVLDASDSENQFFRDNGEILISLSRDNISEFRSLIEKFK